YALNSISDGLAGLAPAISFLRSKTSLWRGPTFVAKRPRLSRMIIFGGKWPHQVIKRQIKSKTDFIDRNFWYRHSSVQGQKRGNRNKKLNKPINMKKSFSLIVAC